MELCLEPNLVFFDMVVETERTMLSWRSSCKSEMTHIVWPMLSLLCSKR